jgi:hypothetical protein
MVLNFQFSSIVALAHNACVAGVRPHRADGQLHDVLISFNLFFMNNFILSLILLFFGCAGSHQKNISYGMLSAYETTVGTDCACMCLDTIPKIKSDTSKFMELQIDTVNSSLKRGIGNPVPLPDLWKFHQGNESNSSFRYRLFHNAPRLIDENVPCS